MSKNFVYLRKAFVQSKYTDICLISNIKQTNVRLRMLFIIIIDKLLWIFTKN